MSAEHCRREWPSANVLARLRPLQRRSMGNEAKAQRLGRLDSWKEIAAYFGRDERTVKRWEGQRGLPIYRAPGGGKTTVYAFVSELEAWLRQDNQSATQSVPASNRSITPEQPASANASSILRYAVRSWLWLSAGVVVLLAGVFVAVQWSAHAPIVQSANPEANRLYRSGLYSWQTRTPAGLRQAIVDFQNAIRADPKFAAAYAGMADCYSLLPEYTDTRTADAFPKAKAAAERAVALNDRLAAAHRSLAYVEFWWTRDNSGALREFRRAIQLDSNSAQTHHWYANALSAMGDFPRALQEMDTAEELEPGSTAVTADKGLLLVDAGRVSAGIQMLQQVETAQPQFAPAHAYLAFAYRLRRSGSAALREMRWHGELTRNREELAIAAAGGAGYAAGGYVEMTRRIVAKEEEFARNGRHLSYALAVEYQRLGETARALALLTQAVADHDRAALAIRLEPEFRALYRDPRFAALAAKEGFTLPKNM